jgi:uncharacterized protein (TIGR00725 family)
LRLTSFASRPWTTVGSAARKASIDSSGVTAPRPSRYVAVCGASDPAPAQRELAREVGRRLAQRGVVVLCGGLGGVMESASQGAAAAGGLVVGILPGADRRAANPHLSLAIATGLGEARNAVLTCAADAVIAIGRGWGTLSEIALARKRGRPVVGLASWPVEGVASASTAEEAVDRTLADLD